MKSATAPIGDGGELTQPKKRGCPLPMGCGRTVAANRSRIALGSPPVSGSTSVSKSARASGVIGVKTGPAAIPARQSAMRSTAR
jgi:hypothetical protein